jgi:hypothetical protein
MQTSSSVFLVSFANTNDGLIPLEVLGGIREYDPEGVKEFDSLIDAVAFCNGVIPVNQMIESWGGFVTAEEFAAVVPSASDLIELHPECFQTADDLRNTLRCKLRDVWKGLSIEVTPGVRLAIDRGSIGAMGVAANVALSMQTDLILDDVNDVTVVIPFEMIQACIGVFHATINQLRQRFDAILLQIDSANIGELRTFDFNLEL